MSRCSRCGAEWCNVAAEPTPEAALAAAVVCRDRELANLRCLLRSVTGKLEKAAEELEGIPPSVSSESARMLIDQVLESLS